MAYRESTVLDVLAAEGQMSADGLRAALQARGEGGWSLAFRWLMAAMEREETVEGWYRWRLVEGRPIRERWYRRRAW